MGLIVPAYVSSETGAVITNAYISILNDSIPLQGNPNVGRMFGPPIGTTPWMVQQANSHTTIIVSRPAEGAALPYEVSATLAVFTSQDARGKKLSPIDTLFVKTSVDLTTNVMTSLYNAAKVQHFPNAVDA